MQAKFLGIVEPSYLPAYSPGMSRLGARLRRLRESRGLTQEQVALGIGHTRPTSVSGWETGAKRISWKNLERVAGFFQLAPRDIDVEREVWDPEAPRYKTVGANSEGDLKSAAQAEQELSETGAGAMSGGRSRKELMDAVTIVAGRLPRKALEDVLHFAMEQELGRRRPSGSRPKNRRA